MPSPFPGIDPYLESQHLWEGFHARFVTYLCDALNDVLPESYVTELGEHVHLMELAGREARQVLPDVAVIEGDWKSSPRAARRTRSTGTLTLEPVTIPLPRFKKEVRDIWIEIRRPPKRAPIAIIEVLSPTNKSSDGFRLIDYATTPVVLRKQDDRAWAEQIARSARP